MTNPIFADNRVKLGVMAFNCSHGSTVTTVPEAWPMTWDENVALAQMADRAGFEALLPVGRWKGYGGQTNFNNRSFESFTWAAGIAAKTENVAVLATAHAPLIHPVAAAKQAATVDHISNGRFVLNIVCGWFKDEFNMFGAEWREHDRRYEFAAEWLALLRRLWSEEAAFDFDGEFFQGQGLWSQPKPVQGADLAIYDCTYTDAEFPNFINWGHSTWQEGVRLSDQAGVKTLVIFHHDPNHADDHMDQISEEAEKARAGTVVAREGMVLSP